MKELQIVYKNISELNPYENNPRLNDEAVEAVANSIKQFGFKVPIIIDSSNIIVVGDIRNRKTGMYRNFVSETIAAFHNAGMELYNEIILLTTLGSLPIRMGRGFSISRKVGKTHQNVLVFYKGDQKKIRDLYGDIDILEISDEDLDI